MQDRGLFEFKTFTGCLQANGGSTPIKFSARIDNAGEVKFDFGTIPLTQETFFIKKCWAHESSAINCFSLSGKSDDGFEFKTTELQFNSLTTESTKDDGSCMSLIGSSSRAEFHRKLSEPAQKPLFRMHLKGFQNFNQLNSNCRLGTVLMDGNSSIDDPDTITGYVSVSPNNEIVDLSTWRKEASDLLEHVRQVMSLASAAVLHAPIIEYFAGHDVEVVAFSQTRQSPSPMRIIHFLDQQPVFDAAVLSFFSPPFKVKNLFFAIEWFAMEATYNEVRLVNAMTVLENLVASNICDSDAMIRPPKEFEKLRTKLRQVIKKCVDKWSSEEEEKAKEVVAELNERLADLNRRSIFQKLKTLSNFWLIPLEGISDDKIKAAKKARDLIVHRGHYYEEGKENSDDLWEHVTVVREIVIRFLLTAIGYKGRYYSYLGGYHESQFPPHADSFTRDE